MAGNSFEDDFMDVQSGLVSLCLEAAEGQPIRDIYIYASLEGRMTVFNAFFRVGDAILPLNQVATDDDLRRRMLRLAHGDLAGLRRLCDEAGRPCPTQIRGHYIAGTGSYRADYAYDPIVARDDGMGVAPGATFAAWMHAVASAPGEDGF
ncbi:hypothetical protein [Bifidobacterium vespertilionis]|uniref:hypothetical protein n=1 Tax=Bifidobacterium vespertilionis TaxID=2562524 RepID=UPI001BDD1A94|nr:hypothetical protein [Bifidobacterium vespertilionis]MBT1180324.1 hypothetical protein [Bifidobacterium vespertilionis]